MTGLFDVYNKKAQAYSEFKHDHKFDTFYSPVMYATQLDFIEGSRAMLELNIPVLFTEYCNNCCQTKKEGNMLYLVPTIQDRWLTVTEMYQYWIDNIYKPEL